MTDAKPVDTDGNKPHPAGWRVWEKSEPLGGGAEMLNSRSAHPEGPVSLSLGEYENLLAAAGYEFKGIADGTATSWAEQVSDGR